jgi:hypothetical protein
MSTEQEPVAYINIEKRRLEWAHDYMSWDTPTVVNLPRVPLYTTPQQRTWVDSASDYERGVIDGRQMQVQSSVDKAVNAMCRTCVRLTNEEIQECLNGLPTQTIDVYARRIEAKLKEKNT